MLYVFKPPDAPNPECALYQVISIVDIINDVLPEVHLIDVFFKSVALNLSHCQYVRVYLRLPIFLIGQYGS